MAYESSLERNTTVRGASLCVTTLPAGSVVDHIMIVLERIIFVTSADLKVTVL